MKNILTEFEQLNGKLVLNARQDPWYNVIIFITEDSFLTIMPTAGYDESVDFEILRTIKEILETVQKDWLIDTGVLTKEEYDSLQESYDAGNKELRKAADYREYLRLKELFE